MFLGRASQNCTISTSGALPPCFLQDALPLAVGALSSDRLHHAKDPEVDTDDAQAGGGLESTFTLGSKRILATLGFLAGGSAAALMRYSSLVPGWAGRFGKRVVVALTPTSRNLSALMSPVRRKRIRQELSELPIMRRKSSTIVFNIPDHELRLIPSRTAIMPVSTSCPNFYAKYGVTPRQTPKEDERHQAQRRARRTVTLPIRSRTPPLFNSSPLDMTLINSPKTVNDDARSPMSHEPSLSNTEGLSIARTEFCMTQREVPTDDTNGKAPTSTELGQLFDRLDRRGTGQLGLVDIIEAIEHLNASHHLGFTRDDARRLLAFVAGTSSEGAHVTRDAFVDEIGALGSVLERMRGQLSMSQLKVVVAAAFERFDLDYDGTLSAEEFMAAASSLKLNISGEDAVTLHRFFAPTQGNGIQQDNIDDRPVWEKWGDALKGCLEAMQKRIGWRSAEQVMDRVREAVEKPGTIHEKVQRATEAVWEGADKIADASDMAVDTAGMALAMHYIADTIQDNQGLSSMDLGGLAPFLIFLGLTTVNLAKELDELVYKEMNENEALLFAQVFHPAGFTQAEFRRLLNLKSCEWDCMNPGFDLTNASDRSLKVIVRGEAEIRPSRDVSPKAKGIALRQGTIINATMLLRGGTLWEEEEVTAKEHCLYVKWDIDDLNDCLKHNPEMATRMDHLLAKSIADTMPAVVQMRNAQRGCAHGASPTPPPAPSNRELAQILSEVVNVDGCPAEGQSFMQKIVRKEDLRLIMSHLCRKLGIGSSDEGCDRLFAFIDEEGKGEVDVATVISKTALIEDVLTGHGKMPLGKLLLVLQRSFESVDVNGDGLMDYSEFLVAAEKMELRMTSDERRALFDFLDMHKTGQVDLKNVKCEEGSFGWVTAMQVALDAQAERKGLSRFLYVTNRVHDVLKAPGDPMKKAQAALATAWDGVDGFADVAEAAADFTGVCASIYGIWQEVCGVAPCLQEGCFEDDLNFAPFLIFLGISGVHIIRHISEGQVSDLTEREAMLYTLAFENQGFTVSQFQRLLKCADFVKLNPGDRLSDVVGSGDNQLAVIVKGTCEIKDDQRGTTAKASTGEFFGEAAVLNQSSVNPTWHKSDVKAFDYTSLLVWDAHRLSEGLKHDERLRTKVQRAVTMSMADRVLNAYMRS